MLKKTPAINSWNDAKAESIPPNFNRGVLWCGVKPRYFPEDKLKLRGRAAFEKDVQEAWEHFDRKRKAAALAEDSEVKGQVAKKKKKPKRKPGENDQSAEGVIIP